MRVRWSTLARWVGGGLAVLLALQALPPLLRPPAPEPLAADIGLPRVRASRPTTPPSRVARVSSARALPARTRVKRRHGRRATGDGGPIEVEVAPRPAPAPVTPAPPPAPAPVTPAPPPPPADGSVEFVPH